jgi:hypothetical protein
VPLLVWFVWQLISATQTVDSGLTRAVLKHFAACVICYFLGRFALSQAKDPTLFWIGILAGFVVVLGLGFNQHYGGLDEMRRFFYQQPNWQQYPPEYLKKILQQVPLADERKDFKTWATGATAKWSLASNAKQHALVRSILEEERKTAGQQMQEIISDLLTGDPERFRQEMKDTYAKQKAAGKWK